MSSKYTYRIRCSSSSKRSSKSTKRGSKEMRKAKTFAFQKSTLIIKCLLTIFMSKTNTKNIEGECLGY